jgi:hypothetical protein
VNRFRFDLAAVDADADLRRVLARTPMGGDLSVTSVASRVGSPLLRLMADPCRWLPAGTANWAE